MTLTVQNFASKYIIHPMSKDLMITERIPALVISIAAGIFTFGIIHLVVYLHERKQIRLLKPLLKTRTKSEAIAAKINTIGKVLFSKMANTTVQHTDVQKKIEKIVMKVPEDKADSCARIALFVPVFAAHDARLNNTQFPVNDIYAAQILAAARYAGSTETEAIQMVTEVGIANPSDLQRYREIFCNAPSTDSDRMLTNSIRCALQVEESCGKLNKLGKVKKSFKELLKELPICQEVITDGADGERVKEMKCLAQQITTLVYYTHKAYMKNTSKQRQENAYSEVLKEVTSVKYPVMFEYLCQAEIKKTLEELRDASLHSKQCENTLRIVSHIVDNDLINITATERLQTLLSDVRAISDQQYGSQVSNLTNVLQTEIAKRKNREQLYETALRQVTPQNTDALCAAFETLPEIVKGERYHDFITIMRSYQSLPVITTQHYPYTKAFVLHQELKEMVVNETDSTKLCTAADGLLQIYSRLQQSNRDITIQTTASLAYERAAHLLRKKNSHSEAQQVLQHAEDRIIIENDHPMNDFTNMVDSLVFLNRDCGFLRMRNMRIAKRNTANGNFSEVAIEFPSNVRNRLDSTVQTLKDHPQLKDYETIPGAYEKKDENGKFIPEGAHCLGHDQRITFHDLPNIEILIGNDKDFYNQHHLLRIRAAQGCSAQELHKAYCRLGLPMAMMPSRDDDLKTEALARALAYRFPKLVYKQHPRLTPLAMYHDLTPYQRKLIDEDIEQMEIDEINNGHLTVINPALGQEAWDEGMRAIAHFMSGGNIEQTSETVAIILKAGLLSSMERYNRAIIGTGCVPGMNCKTGSFNQVFTRALSDNFFEDNFALRKFAINGGVMFLCDLQAMEHMPYSYDRDSNGIRNPHYYLPIYPPHKQMPAFLFHGKYVMRHRHSVGELVAEMRKYPSPTTETMFNGSLSAKYFRRLVVWKDKDKITMMHILEQHGITHLNGTPLNEAIIVANKLDPSMLWGSPQGQQQAAGQQM